MGHEVHLATPVPDATQCYGIKIWKTSGCKIPMNEYCHAEYLDFWESYNIISQVKPDIVHVGTPTFIQFGILLWCYLKGLPVILSYHTHVPEYVKYYGLGLLGRLMSWFFWMLIIFGQNRCSLTLTTSSIMATELKENGVTGTEIKVWPKGVDTEMFNPSKASSEMRSRLMGPSPKKLLLVYVGRLSQEKGLESLVPVMEDERIRGKAHLALVGDGPIREKLEKETFAQLADCVSFHGFITGEELAKVYASCDVFMMPSETETQGLVTVEAMASGLPAIGAKARGNCFTIKDGVTGFLYKPGDTEEIIQDVLTLLESPETLKKYAKTAREDAEQYGWTKATTGLVGIYNDVITKQKLEKSGKQ